MEKDDEVQIFLTRPSNSADAQLNGMKGIVAGRIGRRPQDVIVALGRRGGEVRVRNTDVVFLSAAKTKKTTR